MRLKKRLNNNAVIATDDQNQEYVVFGNGILERISAAAQVSAGDKLFKVE